MKQTKCSKCLLMWDSLVVRKCNHEAVNRTYGKNICICCCQKCRYSEQFKTGWICTYKNDKGVKIMTRYELERHLGKYVEIVLFDGTVIEGILHKTGEKAFENDANLSIPKLRYFCTCGDKVVSNCVFRLSHIKKISRIKIKLKVVDEVKLSKWVKKEVRKVGEAEAERNIKDVV